MLAKLRHSIAASLLLLGCSDATVVSNDPEPVQGTYLVPASPDDLADETWLDHPWPSDLRLVNGSPDFRGFYNARGNLLLAEYLGFAEGLLDGFSPAGAGYLRFTGPLDPATLPGDPSSTLVPTSSVQLIDVDPDSPALGERHPIAVSFRDEEGVYTVPNTLRFIPAIGFPLRPTTTYALVVTDQVRTPTGAGVSPAPGLAAALADPGSPAGAILTPALGPLADAGIDERSIIHMTVFTTGDPTAEAVAVANHVRSGAVEPPDFIDAAWEVVEHGNHVEFLGRFGPNPSYQHGTLPFELFGDGGDFRFDADGRPEVAFTYDLRFSLSVPRQESCPMPTDGYPIVLYAHGTGGSWKSYRSYANTLAERCIAVMGVDQIFHGDYPGAVDDIFKTQILFFNFQNVESARTNGRQSAIDEVHRARLFTEAGASIPATVAPRGSEIRFDGSKLMFFGHSQGGLNGPLYLALDDSARGGVLSGSSSVMSITLLEKTEPSPSIANLVPTVFLGLSAAELEEYDMFHPAVMVAQSLVDAIDPIHYARLTVREPLAGNAPKSILLTEGVFPNGDGDSYAPPRGIEAQGVAMGLPLAEPIVFNIPQLGWGATQTTIPAGGLTGNLAGGAASGVMIQWVPPEDSDGHFVVFDVPAAKAQVAGFLEALAADPVGAVPAP